MSENQTSSTQSGTESGNKTSPVTLMESFSRSLPITDQTTTPMPPTKPPTNQSPAQGGGNSNDGAAICNDISEKAE